MIYGLGGSVVILIGDGRSVLARRKDFPGFETFQANKQYELGVPLNDDDYDAEIVSYLSEQRPGILFAVTGENKENDLAGLDAWIEAIEYVKAMVAATNYDDDKTDESETND